MMELVTVEDGSCTVYVEKNLIKQVVIHPQIQQVPGAPDHICGIMLYERTPVVFCRLGDSGGCTCGFILGLRDGTMIGVIGEPGAEDSGEPEKMMEVMPGIWEKKCDTIE